MNLVYQNNAIEDQRAKVNELSDLTKIDKKHRPHVEQIQK